MAQISDFEAREYGPHTMGQSFTPVFGDFVPKLGHFWTFSIEIFFYLAFYAFVFQTYSMSSMSTSSPTITTPKQDIDTGEIIENILPNLQFVQKFWSDYLIWPFLRFLE